MILKYKVPKEHRKKIYDNKRIIYCKVLEDKKLEHTDLIVYRVEMINYHNFTNIFSIKELKQLNIFDKIRLKLGGYKDE